MVAISGFHDPVCQQSPLPLRTMLPPASPAYPGAASRACAWTTPAANAADVSTAKNEPDLIFLACMMYFLPLVY
jgi:hypothetical protein